jgi:hypothetical protein
VTLPARSSTHPKKKNHKAGAKPPSSTKKTSGKHQGVKGAEKSSPVAPPVASHGTSFSVNWPQTALFLVIASIFGVLAFLRHRRRRARPREVAVEVIQPKALLGAIPLPPVQPQELPSAARASPALHETFLAEQLLADIAPPLVEPSTPKRPEPVRARPPFHEPALPVTVRQEQSVELQAPEPHADDESLSQPIEEICAIGIWRGYVKSRFYATLMGGEEEGIEYALAESQPIRVRGNGTPERTPAAERAHQALVARLIESGWEVEPPANGDSWYALRLRRAAALAESNSV